MRKLIPMGLLVPVIFGLMASAPSVSATDENAENAPNYVTEKQLENFVTSQQLQNAVSELEQTIKELSNRMENLDRAIQKTQEEEEGGAIAVIALTEGGMKPLNFGWMFGGSSPMTMLMMMQQEGGMFSIPTVKPMTPVMLMGEDGLAQDATIDAYAVSENGFMPVNLQVGGGMTVIPPVGDFISGTISAPNYDDTTFYVKIGKAEEKKKPKAGEVEIKSTPKGSQARRGSGREGRPKREDNRGRHALDIREGTPEPRPNHRPEESALALC